MLPHKLRGKSRSPARCRAQSLLLRPSATTRIGGDHRRRSLECDVAGESDRLRARSADRETDAAQGRDELRMSFADRLRDQPRAVEWPHRTEIRFLRDDGRAAALRQILRDRMRCGRKGKNGEKEKVLHHFQRPPNPPFILSAARGWVRILIQRVRFLPVGSSARPHFMAESAPPRELGRCTGRVDLL